MQKHCDTNRSVATNESSEREKACVPEAAAGISVCFCTRLQQRALPSIHSDAFKFQGKFACMLFIFVYSQKSCSNAVRQDAPPPRLWSGKLRAARCAPGGRAARAPPSLQVTQVREVIRVRVSNIHDTVGPVEASDQRICSRCRSMPAICRNLSFLRCFRAMSARFVSSGSCV